MNSLLEALSDIGYMADTPGAYLRGVLGGHAGSRLSGEDMLHQWGVDAGPVGGFAAEAVSDPFALLGLGAAAYRGGRAAFSHLDDAARLGGRLADVAMPAALDRRLADLAAGADPLDRLRAGYRGTVGRPTPIADAFGDFAADESGALSVPPRSEAAKEFPGMAPYEAYERMLARESAGRMWDSPFGPVEADMGRVLDARNWDAGLPAPGGGGTVSMMRARDSGGGQAWAETKAALEHAGMGSVPGYYTQDNAMRLSPPAAAIHNIDTFHLLPGEYELRQRALQAIRGPEVWPEILQPTQYNGLQSAPSWDRPSLMEQYIKAREALGPANPLLQKTVDPDGVLDSVLEHNSRGFTPNGKQTITPLYGGGWTTFSPADSLDVLRSRHDNLVNTLHPVFGSRDGVADRAFYEQLKGMNPLADILRRQGYDGILRNAQAREFLGDPETMSFLNLESLRHLPPQDRPDSVLPEDFYSS